jgi:hypothetical protein
VRQTRAYGSPASVATAAASTNEERKGPRMPAPSTNAATRGIVSKRVGALLSSRTLDAPIRASRQFVAYRE